jgi:hypothetical protein
LPTLTLIPLGCVSSFHYSGRYDHRPFRITLLLDLFCYICCAREPALSYSLVHVDLIVHRARIYRVFPAVSSATAHLLDVSLRKAPQCEFIYCT